jgi:hypothetical protein
VYRVYINCKSHLVSSHRRPNPTQPNPGGHEIFFVPSLKRVPFPSSNPTLHLRPFLPVLTYPLPSSASPCLPCPIPHPTPHTSMVASSNYEQCTPFTRSAPLEPEGFQSSEEESEILSPVFDQPRTAFLPMGCAFISRSPSEPSQFRSSLLHKDRYQSIASDCLLPHDSLIDSPHNSQYYVQSQGLGAHHHGYPKEPPNTAISYTASVQLRTQSFTSSAYELAMAHCSPLLMNSALTRFTTSVDIPSSSPHINPSHFHLSRPPTIASAPIPQAPLVSSADTVDPPTSITAVASTDSSIISSSRAGPARNVSSGVIACQQWCVAHLPDSQKVPPLD